MGIRLVVVAALCALLLAACSGSTTGATSVTSTSAKLNAQAKCGDNGDHTANCYWYFQWGTGGSYQNRSATQGPAGSTNGNSVTLSVSVMGLAPGTAYQYQMCGWGDSIGSPSSPICAGSVSFTTLPAAPSSISPPQITGETLIARPPDQWATGYTLSYQWQRCDPLGQACASITNATAGSYVTQPPDADHTMRVEMTATDSLGNSFTLDSAPSDLNGAPIS